MSSRKQLRAVVEGRYYGNTNLLACGGHLGRAAWVRIRPSSSSLRKRLGAPAATSASPANASCHTPCIRLSHDHIWRVQVACSVSLSSVPVSPLPATALFPVAGRCEQQNATRASGPRAPCVSFPCVSHYATELDFDSPGRVCWMHSTISVLSAGLPCCTASRSSALCPLQEVTDPDDCHPSAWPARRVRVRVGACRLFTSVGAVQQSLGAI